MQPPGPGWVERTVVRDALADDYERDGGGARIHRSARHSSSSHSATSRERLASSARWTHWLRSGRRCAAWPHATSSLGFVSLKPATRTLFEEAPPSGVPSLLGADSSPPAAPLRERCRPGRPDPSRLGSTPGAAGSIRGVACPRQRVRGSRSPPRDRRIAALVVPSSARRQAPSRRWVSSSAARIPPMCARTPISTTPSRTWSTERSSIQASAAAASSGSMSM